MFDHFCVRSIFAIIEAHIQIVIGYLLVVLLLLIDTHLIIIRNNHFRLRLLIILIMVDIAKDVALNNELLDTTHLTIRDIIYYLILLLMRSLIVIIDLFVILKRVGCLYIVRCSPILAFLLFINSHRKS